jgi:hypothetical protein
VKIRRSDHYDASPQVMFDALSRKEYQELKCADAGALSYRVEVGEHADERVIVVERTLPTSGFPALIDKLLSGRVTSTETISWAGAGADGGRCARVSVSFAGAPARMSGTMFLGPAGTGCTIDLDLELRVPVPLFGSRIEDLAVPLVHQLVEAERTTVRAWLVSRAPVNQSYPTNRTS